jgi:hypothetical protein
MKRSSILLCMAIILLSLASGAHATILTYTPTDSGQPDLNDLDHVYYYAWVLRPVIPLGQVITSAQLNIYDIYDWTRESNDRLYIHLLDADNISTPSGANPNNFYRQYTDNQGGGDNWAGNPNIIPAPGYWTDPVGGYARNVNLSYAINLATLATFFNATDRVFGIGFDPDCHYYNKRIELVLNTTPSRVSEPSIFLLIGSGLMGLAFMARRKK